MSIAIIIAEDHALFRSGLKQLLAPEPDLRVVGRRTAARRPCGWRKNCGRT